MKLALSLVLLHLWLSPSLCLSQAPFELFFEIGPCVKSSLQNNSKLFELVNVRQIYVLRQHMRINVQLSESAKIISFRDSIRINCCKPFHKNKVTAVLQLWTI